MNEAQWEGLSEEQRMAVESEAGTVAVIAGPGSGKTRVVAHRVAREIRMGALPERVQCLTFSRSAAREMGHRIAAIDPHDPDVGKAARNCATFHGYAYRLMMGHFDSWKKITVASPAEEERILEIAAEQIGYAESRDGGRVTWKKIRKGAALDTLRKRHSKGEMPYRGTPEFALLQHMETMMDEARMVSYGNILLWFKEKLPEIFEHERLDALILDEAQDMDPLQWEIAWDIHKLSGCSVFAVGDPRQGLYGWRGAAATYLATARRSFLETYDLPTNWRSTRNICRTANLIMEPSGMPARPTQAAGGADDGKPPRFIARGEAAPEKLARRIVMWSAMGAKDIAVLCRTHADADKIDGALSEFGIVSARLSTKRPAAEERAFTVVAAAARLWVNPNDEVSLRLFLASCPNAPFGIGYCHVRRHGDIASKKEPSTFIEYAAEASGPASDDSAWSVFSDILRHKDEEAVVRKALLAAEVDADAALEVQDAIARLAAEQALPNGLSDLPAALADDWEGEVQADEDPGAGAACHIGTVHAAKGREWDRVVVAGLGRGRFPLRSGNVDEERRTLFVAATRAKKELVFCEWPGPIDGDRGLFAQELFPPEKEAGEKEEEITR